MDSFTKLAIARYPATFPASPNTRDRLRRQYVEGLRECRDRPAYSLVLPTGDHYRAHCEPWTEDDTKGWQVVKRRVRVKRVLSDAELNYMASMPTQDYWETGSVDSYTMPLQGGEHNGALFDIGARF